jgi:hypothetical protein
LFFGVACAVSRSVMIRQLSAPCAWRVVSGSYVHVVGSPAFLFGKMPGMDR